MILSKNGNIQAAGNKFNNYGQIILKRGGGTFIFQRIMKEIFPKKLEILRQRIPIGIKEALSLLESTNGDVTQVEILFKAKVLAIILQKTGVTKETATHHLLKNKFNIDQTLKSINEERYTLTERILIKDKYRKESALTKIADAIEKEQNLTRDFWLDFVQFEKLEPEISCLLSIMEWLNYESWEGFDSAIYFNLDIVMNQIENKLYLPQIAEILRRSLMIDQIHAEQQKNILSKEGVIVPIHDFIKQNGLFNQKRSLLIDTLYEFVKKHIDKFP